MTKKAPAKKPILPQPDSVLKPATRQPNSTDSAAGHSLVPGLEGSFEADVLQEWTRAYYQADLPAIFSTPAMIGMMEGACAEAIAAALPADTLSVGTHVEVDHLKAVPLGAHVKATARLVEVDGRFLVFDVAASSGETLIGRGRIIHAVVDLTRFFRIAAGGPRKEETSSGVASTELEK